MDGVGVPLVPNVQNRLENGRTRMCGVTPPPLLQPHRLVILSHILSPLLSPLLFLSCLSSENVFSGSCACCLALALVFVVSQWPRMSLDLPPSHHLLHADGLLPAEAVSPPSTADVSLAALAGASAADLAQMSIVACLQALQAIEDPSARRARTAEVHELMVAHWCKCSRYKSTMARHLVEDVRPTCAYMTIPVARHRLIPILSTHRSTQCFAPDSTLFCRNRVLQAWSTCPLSHA
jgi:hypothetical protein